MMTGYASLDSSIEAMNQGAFTYITKPVNMDQALIIMEKALEKQRLSLENRRLLKELQEAFELQSKLTVQAQAALAQVKTLQGILPICMYCKKIRDDQQYWRQLESYVSSHSQAQFSHSICPDCYQKFVQPELDKLKNEP